MGWDGVPTTAGRGENMRAGGAVGRGYDRTGVCSSLSERTADGEDDAEGHCGSENGSHAVEGKDKILAFGIGIGIWFGKIRTS